MDAHFVCAVFCGVPSALPDRSLRYSASRGAGGSGSERAICELVLVTDWKNLLTSMVVSGETRVHENQWSTVALPSVD